MKKQNIVYTYQVNSANYHGKTYHIHYIVLYAIDTNIKHHRSYNYNKINSKRLFTLTLQSDPSNFLNLYALHIKDIELDLQNTKSIVSKILNKFLKFDISFTHAGKDLIRFFNTNKIKKIKFIYNN